MGMRQVYPFLWTCDNCRLELIAYAHCASGRQASPKGWTSIFTKKVFGVVDYEVQNDWCPACSAKRATAEKDILKGASGQTE